jgi:hypothetical protein
MILSFLFPAMLILTAVAGLEGGEEPAGKDPPPDSDPFNDAESQKNLGSLSSRFAVGANRRFKLQKRRQLFICARDETLSVVAMHVCNEDCSPVAIQ